MHAGDVIWADRPHAVVGDMALALSWNYALPSRYGKAVNTSASTHDQCLYVLKGPWNKKVPGHYSAKGCSGTQYSSQIVSLHGCNNTVHHIPLRVSEDALQTS
eukprot:891008-Pelagomonas_calceolata.AAC.5